MDNFVVYILFSEIHRKTYVGFTSDLIGRIRSHNFLANKGFTKKFRPWMVIHVEFYETKQEAVKIEKFYKTGEGRRKIAEILEKYVEGSYPPKA